MHDQKIIELIRTDKSDKALAALYRHFPLIRKLVADHGGNAQDAEDIFQEALIVLCRKLKDPAFVLTAKLSSYLYSVCRFMWKDELKKRKVTLSANFENDEGNEDQKEWEDMLQQENNARMAEKVLNDLGERCRELLLLFYQGGLKLKDIATKMGYSSENAAKNQKYKCLEGARTRLKEMKQTTKSFN
jgi:RNA polymerase sigma factor (sigma-70 family)